MNTDPAPPKRYLIRIEFAETATGREIFSSQFHDIPKEGVPPSLFTLLHDLTRLTEAGFESEKTQGVEPEPPKEKAPAPPKEPKKKKERPPGEPFMGVGWYYPFARKCQTADEFRDRFRKKFPKAAHASDQILNDFWEKYHGTTGWKDQKTGTQPIKEPVNLLTIPPTASSTNQPPRGELITQDAPHAWQGIPQECRTTRNGLKEGDLVRMARGQMPQGVHSGTIVKILPGLREVKVQWNGGPATKISADNLVLTTKTRGGETVEA